MKVLSFILCMALVLCESSWSGIIAVRAAEAENASNTCTTTVDTGSTTVYYGNGYSVAIEVTAKWNNGYNANVTIENTSNDEIRNWELVMTGEDSVSNIWNAKKLSHENGTLKIGNAGWNQDIAPGKSVSFGFQSLTDSASMPVESYLAGDRQDAADEDYSIVFRAVNAWEGGCVVETDILNLTDKDIEDWDIAFTWKGIKIADIWNAVIDAENDGSYTITNDTYNSTVPANGKVTFGMRLETGKGELIFPSDAKLIRWTGNGDSSNDENKTDDKTDDKTEDKTDDRTEEPADEELCRWNRTMMNMDSDIVREAVNQVDEPIRVAILDSGEDAMPEIPVVERFNLIDGEDEMTEMFEDATGHGTAVASVMAYHREKEEDSGEETEEGNGNTYTYEGFTYEYFTDDTDLTDGEWEEYDEEDEEYDEEPEGTIRLGEFVEEHQADFEGINPNMELYSVRLLDEMNEASVSDVIKGIRWAMENDIKIINISFGTQTDSLQLHKVIKEAEKKGILIIAAAGNNGEVQYPAAYDEVIAVGSVDYTGKVESECENDTYVELTAPGEGVLAVGPFGVETEAGGTSIAAGEVSAVASILWQHDPTVSNRFIRQLLRVGANRSDNTVSGYGIVDCEYSLSIFDDLKATFVDNKDAATEELMEEAGIEENTDELGTEGIVTANWGGKGHLGLIPENVNGVIDNYLNALKIGARLPDGALCQLNKKEKFPAWHGYFNDYKDKEEKITRSGNYVAGYLYLSRMAKYICEGNNASAGGFYLLNGSDYWNSAFDGLEMEGIISLKGVNYAATKKANTLPPNASQDKQPTPSAAWSNIFRSRLYDGNVSAGAILQDEKVTGSAITKKSLVVYGMSLHTMTDTFAHSCWGYGKYAKENEKKKWRWGEMNKLTNKRKANDNKKIRPQRYKAAKQAVLNSMDNIEISDNVLTIKESKTLDFSSRKYYLEKTTGKEAKDAEDVINVNDKIHKDTNNIEMDYLIKGFGIRDLWTNIEECQKDVKCEECENCRKGQKCENSTPDEYFKRIDLDKLKSLFDDYGIAEQEIKLFEAEEGVVASVCVYFNKENSKPKLILKAEGSKDGSLYFALNKNLNEGEYYTIEKKVSEQTEITTIDSRTLFKAPEKTDDETIVGLMDVWDTGERTQNGPIPCRLFYL